MIIVPYTQCRKQIQNSGTTLADIRHLGGTHIKCDFMRKRLLVFRIYEIISV